MQVRGILANAIIATVLGVGGLLLWQRVWGGSDVIEFQGQKGGLQSASLLAATSEARTPEQVRVRLFKEGSFAGTEPAGDWCVSHDKLKPCAGLRQRFEYYVLGLGEVSAEEMRGLIQDEARRAHGDLLAGQIMSIWDQYWQIRTYDWQHKFVQSDRGTWRPVFEEQRSVRIQILGQPWAEAFFRDDERHFQNYYMQLESVLPSPSAPGETVQQMAPKDPVTVHAERVARFGEAGADRLAKADAEWADWERRVHDARGEWDRLQKSTNLSDAQRKAEMAAYVKTSFPADEQLRLQGLLPP